MSACKNYDYKLNVELHDYASCEKKTEDCFYCIIIFCFNDLNDINVVEKSQRFRIEQKYKKIYDNIYDEKQKTQISKNRENVSLE